MEDVAAEAGLTRQAVYLHFKTRSALLVALVEHVDATQGLGELLRPVFQERDPVRALRLFLHVVATYAPKISNLARAIDIARAADEAMAAAWDDRMNSRRAGIRGLLTRIDLAPGWTLARATDAIWAVSAPHVYESLVVERKWSAASFARFLRSAVAAFLAPAAAKQLVEEDE
jgi:AcrR family transcriptional regulator